VGCSVPALFSLLYGRRHSLLLGVLCNNSRKVGSHYKKRFLKQQEKIRKRKDRRRKLRARQAALRSQDLVISLPTQGRIIPHVPSTPDIRNISSVMEPNCNSDTWPRISNSPLKMGLHQVVEEEGETTSDKESESEDDGLRIVAIHPRRAQRSGIQNPSFFNPSN
jgi:hypothetical protein